MGATEIVQALVSPVEKLIDAVSGAIGKAYDPRYARRMAESKAYELQLIAETVRNNSDVPIVYNSDGVAIDASNYEEIAKRTSSRLAFQEITKQQNIESIADKAYEELEGTEAVSSEPVNQDWVTRFFNSVEDIGDEELQKVWAHILAGEIKTPNTYSYRTLEKLRNMTCQEVELFQKIAGLSLSHSGKYFIINDSAVLDKYDSYFMQYMKLEECGLMSAQSLVLTIETTPQRPGIIFSNKFLGIIRGKSTEMKQHLKLNVFVFTESGKQLIQAINPQTDKQYFIDCLQSIRDKNSDFSVTAHTIDSVKSDGSMECSADILPNTMVKE